MPLLLAFIACTPCPEGQIKDPTGSCLTEYIPPTSPEEALDRLPDCTSTAGDGRLDVAGGCADGACSGMTWSEVNAALGETGDCGDFLSDSEDLYCQWQNGALSMFFQDSDYDGVPNADYQSFGLFVSDTWTGTSTEGLGVRVSMRCYLDVLGQPPDEDIGWNVDGDAWYLTELYYADLGLYVNDYSWENGDSRPDGSSDALSLFGAN